MPSFCGVTATDASILRCYGHRCLHFAVLRPPMPSFCCVTATDASILRCSYPRLVVTLVAVHGRRISRQASGKQSLSPVPPTIYHSGVLCRKQAVSIRPVPQASQNNSIRSLSLRDLALLETQSWRSFLSASCSVCRWRPMDCVAASVETAACRWSCGH